MKPAILLALLMAGCAAPKPYGFRPLFPPRPVLSMAPRSSEARKLDTTTTPPADRAIPWQYDTNAYAPNSKCWTLQTSTNLVDWTDIPSPCLTGELRAYATNPAAYFRLRGQ